MAKKPERIQSLDALRGFSVILMVIYHFLFDLVEFLGAPLVLFENPVFFFLQYVFSACFILLAGISSRFSRSNAKRGAVVLAAALGVTLVTWWMDMAIFFGILHFLGVAMLFYALTRRVWEAVSERVMPWLCLGLIVASALVVSVWQTDSRYLWVLGITYPGFSAGDYFPLFPWIFVFLLGTWLGGVIRERRAPAWVYTVNPPVLPAVGRQSFLVYLLHQPVLYFLVLGIRWILF